jgi:hypothetical protein
MSDLCMDEWVAQWGFVQYFIYNLSMCLCSIYTSHLKRFIRYRHQTKNWFHVTIMLIVYILQKENTTANLHICQRPVIILVLCVIPTSLFARPPCYWWSWEIKLQGLGHPQMASGLDPYEISDNSIGFNVWRGRTNAQLWREIDGPHFFLCLRKELQTLQLLNRWRFISWTSA